MGKLCPRECIDRLGEAREAGEEWFVQRAGRHNQCQCKNGVVLCVAESDAVEAPEVPRVRQCQDNAGGERAVGDVWDVECNTCRCTDTGVAACTLKLCNFNLGGQQCRDRDGVSRTVGEEWRDGCIDRVGEARQEGEAWLVERAGRNNQCQCNNGLVLCVAESELVAAPVIPSIRVTEEKDAGARINFPEEKRTAAAGVRSSRRGNQALLKIVEATSQASQ